MSSFMVCGASGFVGQHVVRALLAKSHSVHVLTRDMKRLDQFEWKDHVTIFEGSLEHPGNSADIAFDGLMFLAWEGLPNYHALYHFERNLPQSYNFIKRSIEAGTSHVVVSGTCLEYGMAEGPLKADRKTDPQTSYAIAKDMLHKQLLALSRISQFGLSWARIFYLYGEGQASSSLLPSLKTALDAEEPTFNLSQGEQLRDYLPVEQAATQLTKLLVGRVNSSVNICSGKPISIRRVVEKYVEAQHGKIKLNFGHYPYPNYEPMSFWGSK